LQELHVPWLSGRKKIGTFREWSKTRFRNEKVAEELEIGFEEG